MTGEELNRIHLENASAGLDQLAKENNLVGEVPVPDRDLAKQMELLLEIADRQVFSRADLGSTTGSMLDLDQDANVSNIDPGRLGLGEDSLGFHPITAPRGADSMKNAEIVRAGLFGKENFLSALGIEEVPKNISQDASSSEEPGQ